MGKTFFTHLVTRHIHLQATASILHLNKGGLTEIAPRHNAPGNGVGIRTIVQFVGVMVNMQLKHFTAAVTGSKPIGKGIHPRRPKSINLFTPLLEQFVQFFHEISLSFRPQTQVPNHTLAARLPSRTKPPECRFTALRRP